MSVDSLPQGRSSKRPQAKSPAETTGLCSEGIAADRQLIDQCLAGVPLAWSTLYDQCQRPLLSAIQVFLGRMRSDLSLADEIAARVWYLLIRNEFELLARFDPSRGCRLTTFLAMLAKNETRQLLRSERRRRIREQGAARKDSSELPKDVCPATEQEFLTRLTPGELAFYRDVLVSPVGTEPAKEYSQSNSWQLTHRVRRKLTAFLADGET